MTDGYAYIMPMRGTSISASIKEAGAGDPERLLEGTGKGLRHAKIRSLAKANRPSVRTLVATALARRRSSAHRSGPGVQLRAARTEQDLLGLWRPALDSTK